MLFRVIGRNEPALYGLVAGGRLDVVDSQRAGIRHRVIAEGDSIRNLQHTRENDEATSWQAGWPPLEP